MDINKLKESMLRAEGYGQGFKDGYASCVKMILDEEKKGIIPLPQDPQGENNNAN